MKPFVPWIALFIAINLLFPMVSNTNPLSRLALLFSLVEDHTVSINSYKNLTVDWAQAPNGHYYSNKAPGSALLALPFFWVADKVITSGANTREERDALRIRSLNLYSSVTSLLIQMLPFAVFGFLVLLQLQKMGVSRSALHVAALGIFFGNTTSLMMNAFFGHAFSAAMLLGTYFFLMEERFFLMGLVLGLSALGDYLCVLAVPIFLALSGKKGMKSVVLGGLIPLTLWVVYHTSAFGSPLRTALQFENPEFDNAVSFPPLLVIGKLLFGKMRGLLWAMPWVFVIVLGLRKGIPEKFRKLLWFLGISFPLWLIVNSGFNGWHGGQFPGPRYLSPILPLFAILLAAVWDRWPGGLRVAASIGMIVSLLLFIAVIAADPHANTAFQEMPDYYGGLLSTLFSRPFYREASLVALFGFTALSTDYL